MLNFLSRSKQLISRRTMMLSALIALPFPILLGRLYYLQNVVGGRYKNLADKNRLQMRPLRPIRGKLLDRFGRVIAEDRSA